MGDQGQPPRHGALAKLATQQHGVVATRQLAPLGYTKSSVAKAAKAGRLHRIHRGVYVVGHRRLSWHGRCMAAVLASWPSVASHLSAAWMWGVIGNRPGTIHVTCRTSRRVHRQFVVHASDLADVDRTVRDGIPVTSLPRTILDLAIDHSLRDIGRQIQRADDFKVFDLREMRELLDRSNGHQGRRRSRPSSRPTGRNGRSSPAPASSGGSSSWYGRPGCRSPR